MNKFVSDLRDVDLTVKLNPIKFISVRLTKLNLIGLICFRLAGRLPAVAEGHRRGLGRGGRAEVFSPQRSSDPDRQVEEGWRNT